MDTEYVDINPLIMDYNGEHWEHPYIETFFNPNYDEDEYNSGYDDSVYRIYWQNKENEHLFICFKSFYLDEKCDKYFSSGDIDDLQKQDVFKYPYINVPEVYTALHLTLTEDSWSPRPIPNNDIKNSRQYAKYAEQYPSEQFLFSKFGELINNKFSEYKIDFFSLDCAMYKGEDGVYGWDS